MKGRKGVRLTIFAFWKVFVIFKLVPSACPSPSYLFDIKICLKYVLNMYLSLG